MIDEKQEVPLSQTETAAEPEHQEEAETTPPAVEAEARKMGWKAKDQYEGPPEQWRDAAAYVARGKEFEPFVAAKLKRDNAALQAKLDRQAADFQKRTAGLERMTRVALEQQRNAIEERYAERKALAVETGDREGYDRLVKGEKAALHDLDEKTKPDKADDGKPAPLTEQERDAFEDWRDDNTWFKADTEMTEFADRRFLRVKRDNPTLGFGEVLDRVREAVEEKFPDKFRKGGRANGGSSRVEGGERIANDTRSGKTKWAQLPAEAKSQADTLIKNDRLFLKKGETIDKNLQDARERYAASYLEQA